MGARSGASCVLAPTPIAMPMPISIPGRIPDLSGVRERVLTAAPDKPVTLAVIIGAHGIAGELRLKLFTGDLASLKRHKNFNEGTLTLASIRANKDGAIARIAEVTDRNGAEALRGTELTVPRSALPALDEGEYYHVDLLGRSCVTPDGKAIGTVLAVHDYGAGDLIEIDLIAGKTLMVPVAETHDAGANLEIFEHWLPEQD